MVLRRKSSVRYLSLPKRALLRNFLEIEGRSREWSRTCSLPRKFSLAEGPGRVPSKPTRMAKDSPLPFIDQLQWLLARYKGQRSVVSQYRTHQCLVETKRSLKHGAKSAKLFGPCLTRNTFARYSRMTNSIFQFPHDRAYVNCRAGRVAHLLYHFVGEAWSIYPRSFFGFSPYPFSSSGFIGFTGIA